MTSLQPFLTAEWRYLVMLNYRVAPEMLDAVVPAGTELDTWQGAHYVSVVGFLFRNTRVIGLRIPFHTDFEEVNLRFYVRRQVGGEIRRAVTFIRELVPRVAIAATARVLYHEPYRAVPMASRIEPPTGDAALGRFEYRWRAASSWTAVRATVNGAPSIPSATSEAAFITEHYWGYTRQRDGSTVEYYVEHAPWRVWQADSASIDGDLAPVYGPDWAAALRGPPASAFVADGSAIRVSLPVRLPLASADPAP